MANGLFLYEVSCPDEWRVDIVAATCPEQAVMRADLMDHEGEPYPVESLTAKLVEHKGGPVEVGPSRYRTIWENPKYAPILRHEGYTYGEADGCRCEACGLDSFDGWKYAPATWAVCGDCCRCLACAADEAQQDVVEEMTCNWCAPDVRRHLNGPAPRIPPVGGHRAR